MNLIFCFCILLLLPLSAWAEQDTVLNIYAYSGEVPDAIVRQFEKETGIEVNISTYESNEIMYAKLRANPNNGYDLVMPSSYFVDRMRKQNLLEKIDKSKLSLWSNINHEFINPSYDPNNNYSIPYLWGLTGIFINTEDAATKNVKKWSDLWNPKFKDQLLMLDDTREVFSMALLSLGYSANDSDPKHIEQAYLKLKALMDNVKVFSIDTVVAIMTDQDANLGMAWNGDAFRASLENKSLEFIFPEDGFVIWVDNFSIPKRAPHKQAAYAFLNFILRPDIAKQVALATRYPTTNLAAQNILPPEVKNSPISYPSEQVLKRGQFQTDLSQDTLDLYEKYWELLKMGN